MAKATAVKTDQVAADDNTPPATNVAVQQTGGSVTTINALTELMRQSAGQGVSKAQEDNLIPLIYVLQSNSPQCMHKHEKQIVGAHAGNIWLRNAADDPLIDGDEGMLFQPCYFSKMWVEWIPDRGGFVASHPQRPKAAYEGEVVKEDGSPARAWLMPNGNHLVETRSHVGHVLRKGSAPLPYTIPLSSTGHTVSKGWMTNINALQFQDGSTLPSYGAVWRLKTKLFSKNNRNWFQYVIERECRLDDADAEKKLSGMCDPMRLYMMGKALYLAFEGGEKIIDVGEVGEVEESGSSVNDEL